MQTNTYTNRFGLIMLIVCTGLLPPATVLAQAPFTDINAGLQNLQNGTVDWGDYDNDGDLDILLTGTEGLGSLNHSFVYRNNGDGTFSDINAGLTDVAASNTAWGDYDNDGYLDILLTGTSVSQSPPGPRVSKVYHNNGDGSFSDINAGLTGVASRSAEWGDYDNDGDLDILLTGEDASNAQISKIYRNDNGAFTGTDPGLAGIVFKTTWGDYDNDGDLDILLSGFITGVGFATRMYRNNGDGSYSEDAAAGLPDLLSRRFAWGDYDNDGDLDILLFVNDLSTGDNISKVYNNDNGVFSENTAAGLTGVNGSADWGDYDNDGDLDILLAGIVNEVESMFIYRNNGNGSFSDISAGLPATDGGDVAWGDYDNDGDLDFLVNGHSSGAEVFRNNIATANSVPTAPGGLTATPLSGNRVALAWNPASDNETPASGLSYNLRVGSTPGGSDVVGPMANTSNGYRRVPQLGPQQVLLDTLTLPQTGIHYWSVQAIDAAFAGGPFAAEGTFSLGGTIVNDLVQPKTKNVKFTNGQFKFDLALKNISGTNISIPIKCVLTELNPGPPTITVANADGGGDGVGSYFDYSNQVGSNNLLTPNETSSYKTWIFDDPGGAQFTFFADVYGNVSGGLPKAGALAKLKITVNTETGQVDFGDGTMEIEMPPSEFSLAQNYPNPFNPETKISYSLPEAAAVKLIVYNLKGQQIKTLVSGDQPAGNHEIIWNARDDFGQPVASGIYIYRITAGEFSQVQKLTLVR